MRAAIVLAAGAGRRLGGRGSKPLALRLGRPLLAYAMRAARAAPVGRLLVVTGRQGTRVAAAARRIDPRAVVVRAAGWRSGRAASLGAGVRALWPAERRALVFLADMPEAGGPIAGRLLRRARGVAMRPVSRGTPGHPVLLGPAELARVRAGGRPRFAATLPADRRAVFDVDRRARLAARVPALN